MEETEQDKQEHKIHPLITLNIPDEELKASANALLEMKVDEIDQGEGGENYQGEKKGFIYVSKINLYFSKERTHTKDWNQTHNSLKTEKREGMSLRMPMLLEFRQYLRFLDENKSNLEYKTILDEITQVRELWRANWIDAFFEQREDGFYILTRNKTKAEKLQDYLMEDKKPGINFHEYLYNDTLVTAQGLPKPNFPQGDFYYWQPINGTVAGFFAVAGGAVLGCCRDPAGRCSSLGVYACAEGAKA